MSYQLSVSPLKLQDIPPEDTIVTLGTELLDSTAGWKKGRILAKGKVLTLSRPKGPADGAPWHCRVSEHTREDATFDEFWSKLGANKAENEKESHIVRISPATLLAHPCYQIHRGHQESRSSEAHI